MKHVARISKSIPAMAIVIDDHPGIEESIKAFIDDPQAVLQLHIDALVDKLGIETA